MKTLKSFYLWAKEFFIPCRLRKRYWEDRPFLIIGHRGSPHKEPENTIESLESALKEGANALEIDLCLTKDEEIILWHDWNPNDMSSLLRENGFEPIVKYKPLFPAMFSEYRKTINEFTLDESRKYFGYLDKDSGEQTKNKIPTLHDFFEWSIHKENLLFVFLDLKIPENRHQLASVLLNKLKGMTDEYDPSFEIIIETNLVKLHKDLRKNFPKFNFCLDIEPPGGFIFFPRMYSAVKTAIKNENKFAVAIKPRQITIGSWITHRRIINYDVKRRARYNKKNPEKRMEYLCACTINDAKEMECLIKLGIDGIQTDNPGLLKETVDRMGR